VPWDRLITNSARSRYLLIQHPIHNFR